MGKPTLNLDTGDTVALGQTSLSQSDVVGSLSRQLKDFTESLDMNGPLANAIREANTVINASIVTITDNLSDFGITNKQLAEAMDTALSQTASDVSGTVQ